MPGCPDCGAANMKRHGGFYVCERCGLSLKPWEFQQAQERARREIEELTRTETQGLKNPREHRKYRRWIEGQKEIEDDDY